MLGLHERLQFIDRRSKTPENMDSRRTQLLTEFGAVLALTTSERKLKRMYKWLIDVQGFGSGESLVPFIPMNIGVNEPDYLDSGELGREKIIRQIERTNCIPEFRSRYAEIEQKGKKYVLFVSCDVNSTVEEIGGGGRKGIRKDPDQDEWTLSDFAANMNAFFCGFTEHGMTFQSERVDTMTLAGIYKARAHPLVTVPVVSQCFTNIPGNHFRRNGLTFASNLVKYLGQRPGIGREQMARMPLGLDLSPTLAYILLNIKKLANCSDYESVMPSVDLPPIQIRKNSWEEEHLRKKQSFAAMELEECGQVHWASKLSQVDHELAGPVGEALTTAFDTIQTWVDSHRIGSGKLLSTPKKWIDKLPNDRVVYVKSRKAEQKS